MEEGEDRTLVGAWMNAIGDDLKAPVRDAGEGNQLNTFPELSVAFWRWAMWKLFESEGAPQRGVVAYITNRKFLTSWPNAGLRRMMRERIDRIEIIDLRSDVRRGPRACIEREVGCSTFPADHAVFQRAAALGVRIRATQTFENGVRPASLADAAFLRLQHAPTPGASLAAVQPDGTRLTLCADGSGVVDGLPARLWGFEVSGYPVLARWLQGRRAWRWTWAFSTRSATSAAVSTN